MTLALALLVAALGATTVLQAGWYDASAVRPHFQVVHTLIERGLQQSVRFHARDVQAPPHSAQAALRGGALYRRSCEQCHGGPGVAQDTIGLSMQPVPGPLVDAARRWHARELYWITRNGIKMSGMPAWGFHLDEQEIWDLVAFLRELPGMTPGQYQRIAMNAPTPEPEARQPTRLADAKRGRLALTQFACQACHRIPGVTGPQSFVGPALDGLAGRSLIAGQLPMGQDNLVKWIRAPQEVKPGTAMPRLGVPEQDARDMAAYLLQAR